MIRYKAGDLVIGNHPTAGVMVGYVIEVKGRKFRASWRHGWSRFEWILMSEVKSVPKIKR